jgi:ABC-2 type transport system ATP-binding protein
MNMEPAVRLTNLTKRFGRETALNQVSLEVPPGVVFALLGENGAGKTTAIRIMLGLADANSGGAEVLGMKSAKQGIDIRRRVGYVPEGPTLYDWMTVGEIGWFAAGFYGDGFLTEYRRLADQFGLPAKRKLKALSKGMRAKVALALAMANRPELLVLDEPTSGLDALVRREFLESMVDRAAAGQTVFLSSHQIGEVERVADIVAILREGKLLLVQRLDDLKGQVREVTITFAGTGEGIAPDLPELGGQVIGRHSRSRQLQILVCNMPPDEPKALQKLDAISSVEVRSPSLEEIFVAYMQMELDEADGAGTAARPH